MLDELGIGHENWNFKKIKQKFPITGWSCRNYLSIVIWDFSALSGKVNRLYLNRLALTLTFSWVHLAPVHPD
jgi:hypothetical protein